MFYLKTVYYMFYNTLRKVIIITQIKYMFYNILICFLCKRLKKAESGKRKAKSKQIVHSCNISTNPKYLKYKPLFTLRFPLSVFRFLFL